MKKLSEIYKEMGIDFSFPIEIKNSNGKETYFEEDDGCWIKSEYDSKGNLTYFENNDGFWSKSEYDSEGNETYYENSNGIKLGTPKSSKTCNGKVIEVDGTKYKLTAL